MRVTNSFITLLMWNICRVYYQNTRWMNHKIVGRNINNLRYTDGKTEKKKESEEEIKSILMRVNEKSEKYCWKLNNHKNKDQGIWSHHYSANRRGKHMEITTSLIFSGSKITKNGDCGHQIKCHLLLDVKSKRNLDIAVTRRHITLPNFHQVGEVNYDSSRGYGMLLNNVYSFWLVITSLYC